MRMPSNRRRFLLSASAATGLGLAGITSNRDAFAQAPLAPTPTCDDGDAATPRQTEGPYFKPRSPERADLREPGMSGQPVELSGLVLTRSCKPVARALVDLWQADDKGSYDNAGFTLRGHILPMPKAVTCFAPSCPAAIRAVPAIFTSRCRRRTGPC